MKFHLKLITIFFFLSFLINCNTTSSSEPNAIIAGNVILLTPKIQNNGQIVDTLRFSYSINDLKIYLYELINNSKKLLDSTYTYKGNFYFYKINNNNNYCLYARIGDDFIFKIAELIKSNTTSDTIFAKNCILQNIKSSWSEELKCFPNPFTFYFDIQFSLDSNLLVNIDIYNISGEIISNIVEKEILYKGTHIINCNLELEPGFYFIILKKGGLKQFNIMYKPEI